MVDSVMAMGQHQGLTRELRQIIEDEGSCVICGLKVLLEERARELYGPDFDVVRYRFDRSKKELEALIFEFTPNAIPDKYLDLMSQLVAKKQPYETILHSQTTGSGVDRSSLMMTIPGVSAYDELYGTEDGYLSDPDDVPPNSGWSYMSVDGENPHISIEEAKPAVVHVVSSDNDTLLISASNSCHSQCSGYSCAKFCYLLYQYNHGNQLELFNQLMSG